MRDNIAVSILGKEHKAELVNKLISKGFYWIHYDIMDGIFVKNKSLPFEEMDYVLQNTNSHIKNLHLMVADPIKYIQYYKSKVDYITFHYEAESIDMIKKIIKKYSNDSKLGLAINPKTNVNEIKEFVPHLTHILIMSVVPGRGGQSFIENSLIKIRELKEYIFKIKSNCFIQVDGGINTTTGPLAFQAGVNNAVSGSFLLNNLSDNKIKEKLIGKKKK